MPRAMSPAQAQALQPHMVSLMGSPTPRWSSSSVRRCTMSSACPLPRLPPPCALSVTMASSAPEPSSCAIRAQCEQMLQQPDILARSAALHIKAPICLSSGSS